MRVPGSLLPSTPLEERARRRKDGSTPRPLLSRTVCSLGNASAPRAAAVKAAAQEEKAVRVAPRLAMAADISRVMKGRVVSVCWCGLALNQSMAVNSREGQHTKKSRTTAARMHREKCFFSEL